MKFFLCVLLLFQLSKSFQLTNENTTMRCYIQMRKIRNSLQQNIFSMHQQIQNRKHLTPMLNSSYRILEEKDEKNTTQNDNSKEEKQKDNEGDAKQEQQEEESSEDEDQDLEKVNEQAFEPLFREHTNQKSLKKIVKDLHTDLKEVETKFVKNTVQEADVRENYKNNMHNQYHELYFKCEVAGGFFEKFTDFQLSCREHERASIKLMHSGKVERTIVINIANFFENQTSDSDQLIDVYDFKHEFDSNMSFPIIYKEPEICTVFIKGLNKLKIFAIVVILVHYWVNQLQCYQTGIYLKKSAKELQLEIQVKTMNFLDKTQAKLNQIMNMIVKQIL